MNSILKSPAEKFPVHFNYSYDLTIGETVASYVLTCVNKATGADSKTTIIDSDSLSTPEVMAVVKGGAENEMHEITCVATTSAGNEYKRELRLVIQTLVTDDFIKPPQSTFSFAVDYDKRLENGDDLASAAVTAVKESDNSDVYGSIVLPPEVLGDLIGVPVTGGVHGETYRIGVKGTTDAGYIYEKTIRMIVQEN